MRIVGTLVLTAMMVLAMGLGPALLPEPLDRFLTEDAHAQTPDPNPPPGPSAVDKWLNRGAQAATIVLAIIGAYCVFFGCG